MLNILFQVAEKILLFDSTLKFPDSLLQVSFNKFIMIYKSSHRFLPEPAICPLADEMFVNVTLSHV